MRNGRLWAMVLLVLFAAGFVPVRADEIADKVDKVFAPFNRTDTPGCAVGVIRDGKLIYERGYGMANLEYGLSINSQSIFRTGSVSKQFTAMATALLAEQGKISLDDDIRKHLPEMPDYGKPVTVRHLIHHTSGLRDYLELMALAGYGDDDHYTDEDVVNKLARQKELNFEQGSEYLYSNAGYFLLSQIILRASGQTLPEFAEKNMFGPLGMKDTHFHDDYTHIVKNRASGHSPKKEGGFRINETTLGMVGDGGVYTTVRDMLLWDQNFYHNKLGKRGQELIKLVETPGRFNSGEEQDYAFGLRVVKYRGLKTVGHGGSFVGFRAATLRFSEQKFSVVVLCNLSSANPGRLAQRVADIYLGNQMEPAEPEAERARRESEETEMEAEVKYSPEEFAGDYYSDELEVTYKLAAEEGKLYLRNRNAPEGALQATGPDKFRSQPLRLQFVRDKKGQVAGFRVETGRVKNIYFTKQ